MTCEDVQQELEAYVLGALDEEEARLVEAHAKACAHCAAEARAYESTVSYLALSVPLYRASPRLKDRILSSIGAVRPLGLTGFFARRWVLGSAAAVLLAFAIGGAVWAVMLSREVSRLRTDNVRLAELTQLDAEQRTALLQLRSQLSSAQNEQFRMSRTLEEQARLIVLALDPQLIPTEMQGTSLAPSARCNYVWSGQQGVGALTCRDLPSMAFGLTYELWATKGDKTLALGTFKPNWDGTASLLVKFPPDAEGAVSNLWITLERDGTARARPSNDVVVQRVASQQAAR